MLLTQSQIDRAEDLTSPTIQDKMVAGFDALNPNNNLVADSLSLDGLNFQETGAEEQVEESREMVVVALEK